MIKNILAIIITIGFGLTSFITTQAEEISQKRDLASFEKIVIKDAGVSLDVRVGEDFSVTLKGSAQWANRMTTKVEGNALVITRQDRKKRSVNFNGDNYIIITMPKFTGLKVNGAVDAEISGIDSDKLKFEVNGAGNIEVKGSCGRLKVDLNGAGNFEGPDLKCKDVKVTINGAGNVETYGSNSANLTINGFGNIDLYGNPPEINKDKSWFSNITIHKK